MAAALSSREKERLCSQWCPLLPACAGSYPHWGSVGIRFGVDTCGSHCARVAQHPGSMAVGQAYCQRKKRRARKKAMVPQRMRTVASRPREVMDSPWLMRPRRESLTAVRGRARMKGCTASGKRW